MNTHIDPNDPRLMDLVLGELEPDEAKTLTAQLQLPENESARQEVNALRGAAATITHALRQEKTMEPAELSSEQRDQLLRTAERITPLKRRFRLHAAWALAAAVLLCLGLAYYAVPGRMRESAKRYNMAANEIGDLKSEANAQKMFADEESRPATAEMSVAAPVEKEVAEDVHLRLGDGAMDAPSTPTAPASAPPPPPQQVQDQLQSLGYGGSAAAAPQPEPAPEAKAVAQDVYMQVGSTSADAVAPSESALDGDEWDELSVTTMGEGAGGFTYASPIANVPASGSAVRQIVVPPMPPGRLPYPGGESYAQIEEKPFTAASETPLSTFSMHPDSAAYANVKRFLEQGQWPHRDAVRIEELVNYFSYDYPQPTGKHPFSVNVEVAACPWAAGHLLAKVGLQGKTIDPGERPAANLVFLIDTSGSMSGANRLPLVQESLKALLAELQPRDRVAIVTYSGQSAVALTSTPASDRDTIRRVIDSLRAGGSTHGSAGIQDAYAIAQEHFIPKGINRVILATDGDFNVGLTSHDALLSLIETKRQSGVFLTVLGYGMGNLKDGTLEMLAGKGNGNYAYINDYTEARKVLVEQVSGTLMTIAKDAKIQVEFNPGQVKAYRLLGYENRMLAARDFNDDAKDAGEIGAGHTVTALYQIVPQGSAVDPGVDALRYQTQESEAPRETAPNGSGELMFVKLRYKQPDRDTSELIEIPVPARPLALPQSSTDFRCAAAAAGFGLLLRDSAYKGNANFDNILELASSAVADDHRREDFLNLIVAAKTLRGQ